MKSYPSISKEIYHNKHIYAFNKYDGSNIRAEWNRKKGFYKFGTRTQLIDESSKPFGCAINLIKDKYGTDLEKIFSSKKWESVICFFELWGKDSFAGNHNFNEALTVTLLDVNPFKMGLLEPDIFLKLFGHLDIAKVLYQGEVTTELFDMVKQSTLPGMHLEGVVCKGASDKNTKMPIMFKIKSKAWLEKLRAYCKDNDNLYKMLE